MTIPAKYFPSVEQVKDSGHTTAPINMHLFMLLVRRTVETTPHKDGDIREKPMRWVVERHYPGAIYGTTSYYVKRRYIMKFKARWKDLIDLVADSVAEGVKDPSSRGHPPCYTQPTDMSVCRAVRHDDTTTATRAFDLPPAHGARGKTSSQLSQVAVNKINKEKNLCKPQTPDNI